MNHSQSPLPPILEHAPTLYQNDIMQISYLSNISVPEMRPPLLIMTLSIVSVAQSEMGIRQLVTVVNWYVD